MTHTKEPWHTGEGNETIVYDKDGWGICSATVFHGRHEPDTAKENARRIAACVNACAGISIEALESQGDKAIHAIGQRDQLISAIKNLGLEDPGAHEGLMDVTLTGMAIKSLLSLVNSF